MKYIVILLLWVNSNSLFGLELTDFKEISSIEFKLSENGENFICYKNTFLQNFNDDVKNYFSYQKLKASVGNSAVVENGEKVIFLNNSQENLALLCQTPRLEIILTMPDGTTKRKEFNIVLDGEDPCVKMYGPRVTVQEVTNNQFQVTIPFNTPVHVRVFSNFKVSNINLQQIEATRWTGGTEVTLALKAVNNNPFYSMQDGQEGMIQFYADNSPKNRKFIYHPLPFPKLNNDRTTFKKKNGAYLLTIETNERAFPDIDTVNFKVTNFKIKKVEFARAPNGGIVNNKINLDLEYRGADDISAIRTIDFSVKGVLYQHSFAGFASIGDNTGKRSLFQILVYIFALIGLVATFFYGIYLYYRVRRKKTESNATKHEIEIQGRKSERIIPKIEKSVLHRIGDKYCLELQTDKEYFPSAIDSSRFKVIDFDIIGTGLYKINRDIRYCDVIILYLKFKGPNGTPLNKVSFFIDEKEQSPPSKSNEIIINEPLKIEEIAEHQYRITMKIDNAIRILPVNFQIVMDEDNLTLNSTLDEAKWLDKDGTLSVTLHIDGKLSGMMENLFSSQRALHFVIDGNPYIKEFDYRSLAQESLKDSVVKNTEDFEVTPKRHDKVIDEKPVTPYDATTKDNDSIIDSKPLSDTCKSLSRDLGDVISGFSNTYIRDFIDLYNRTKMVQFANFLKKLSDDDFDSLQENFCKLLEIKHKLSDFGDRLVQAKIKTQNARAAIDWKEARTETADSENANGFSTAEKLARHYKNLSDSVQEKKQELEECQRLLAQVKQETAKFEESRRKEEEKVRDKIQEFTRRYSEVEQEEKAKIEELQRSAQKWNEKEKALRDNIHELTLRLSELKKEENAKSEESQRHIQKWKEEEMALLGNIQTLKRQVFELESEKDHKSFKAYFEILSNYRKNFLPDSETRLNELFREKYNFGDWEINDYRDLFARSYSEINIALAANRGQVKHYADATIRWNEILLAWRKKNRLRELSGDLVYISPQVNEFVLKEYILGKIKETEILLKVLANEFNLILGGAQSYRQLLRDYFKPIEDLEGFQELQPQINDAIFKNNNVYLTNVKLILQNRRIFEEKSSDVFTKKLERLLCNDVAIDVIGTNLLRCIQILKNAQNYQARQSIDSLNQKLINENAACLGEAFQAFESEFKNIFQIDFVEVNFFSSEFTKGELLYECADNDHPWIPFDTTRFMEKAGLSENKNNGVIIDVDKWPVIKPSTKEKFRSGRYYIL